MKVHDEDRLATDMRALITRPPDAAAELAAALAARGIGALVEPLIEIRLQDGPPPDLAGVQAVLCTSANGVRALAHRTAERHCPVLAVGDATAARARAEGFVSVDSAGGDLADLVRLAGARLRPQGGRLVHVRGSVVAGDLAAGLGAAGFAVASLVLYEARPVAAMSPAAVAALGGGTVDFALFFSPRTAAVFARLVAEAGIAPAMRSLAALSISRAADAALADLPFRARHHAGAPNQEALLALVDRLLAEMRTGPRI